MFRLEFDQDTTCPFIIIPNVKVEPFGDSGVLSLAIADSPIFAAAWDALEEHGFERDIMMVFEGRSYYYLLYLKEDEDDAERDHVVLVPDPELNDTLPQDLMIKHKRVFLVLRW